MPRYGLSRIRVAVEVLAAVGAKLRAVYCSSRIGTTALNPIAMAERQARARGVALRSLNDANPTRHGLSPDVLPQQYDADPRGPRHMRQALAAMMRQRDGRTVDVETLYALNSTSQAYSWLMKVLCDPGDVIVAPTPGYPLIESIARLECVNVRTYRLAYDGSWYIDLPSLRALLDDTSMGKVRALVVINPNNPTGSYMRATERETIVRWCRERDIAIIADEVFYEYALDAFDDRRRWAGESRALTFALDGCSKLLAAPHAKIGWIEVSGPDDDVRQACAALDVVADDYLPMSALIDERVDGLLALLPRHTAMVRARVRDNLDTLHAMLSADQSAPVSALRTEGGWSALLRVPSCIDDNALVTRMIAAYDWTGQPGYLFDMTTNGYMAVSLLPEPSVFVEGVQVLLRAVRDELAAI